MSALAIEAFVEALCFNIDASLALQGASFKIYFKLGNIQNDKTKATAESATVFQKP